MSSVTSDCYIAYCEIQNAVADEGYKKYYEEKRMEVYSLLSKMTATRRFYSGICPVSASAKGDARSVCLFWESGENDSVALSSLLTFLSDFQSALFAWHGLLIRGALCFGEVTRTDKNEVEGPAVDKANRLQSEFAEYPRIILDKDVADDTYTYLADKFIHTAAGNNVISKDEDGYYYVDYVQQYVGAAWLLNIDRNICLSRAKKNAGVDTDNPDVKKMYGWINGKIDGIKTF